MTRVGEKESKVPTRPTQSRAPSAPRPRVSLTKSKITGALPTCVYLCGKCNKSHLLHFKQACFLLRFDNAPEKSGGLYRSCWGLTLIYPLKHQLPRDVHFSCFPLNCSSLFSLVFLLFFLVFHHGWQYFEEEEDCGPRLSFSR